VRRLITFASILVLAGSLGVVGPSAARAPAGLLPKAEVTGTVLFTSNRDGDWDIYAVNPDGTGLTQLTHNNIEDSFPVPSPDGRLIAFNYRGALALMNADGSGRRPVQACSSFMTSAWAPDSTRLVCEANGGRLAIADAANGTVTPLTPRGSYATWSPDGQTIAFSNQGLWVVPAAGGTPRRVGNREPYFATSWSPDSQRLAYGSWVVAGRARRLDLFRIALDGSGEHRLAQGIGESPSGWSPDGSLIAFVKHPQGFPGHFGDVYTVRADGSALQRVTVSRGGEASSAPAWTGDGAALIYIRQRYRGAYDSDVFLTSPGAGPGLALTQPFPVGGVNLEARWRPGPPVSGTPVLPRTISLPLARKLTLSDPVEEVAADGRRAVAYAHTSCRGVIVWNSATRRAVRTPRLCGEGSVGQVVLAGRRLAATSYAHGNTEDSSELSTLRLGSHRVISVTATVAYSEGGGDALGNLLGSGRTIAFTSYHNPGGRREKRQVWLLVTRHGNPCPGTAEVATPARLCRRVAGTAGGATESIDAARILTLAPGGVARLLSTGGRVLRAWRLGRRITNAELGGRTLAVQRAGTLTAYDTTSGAKKRTRPLAADEGRPPWLVDVQGDLATYVTGGAIHLLRLSDGRDVALDLPGAAPWLDARLEPSGLFVTWNQMYHRRPGRLAFVPMRTVLRGFE